MTVDWFVMTVDWFVMTVDWFVMTVDCAGRCMMMPWASYYIILYSPVSHYIILCAALTN